MARDPIVEKRRSRSLSESVVTFRECADEFCKAKLSSFRSAKHKSQWRSSLDVACKVMGNTPIDDIDTALVLRVLKPLWDRAPETASRLRGRIERVLGFAIASGHRKNDSNPARWQGHLKDLFPPRPTTNTSVLSITENCLS
jgi:hypothetical protein